MRSEGLGLERPVFEGHLNRPTAKKTHVMTQRWKQWSLFSLLVSLAGGVLFFAFAPGVIERGRNPVSDHDPYQVSQDARRLHQSLIIADWHADSLLWKRNLLERSSRGHVDFPRLREGNVAIQVFAAVTKSPKGQNYQHNRADALDNITLLSFAQLWPLKTWGSLLERALYQAQKLHDFEAAAPDQLRIIRSAGDLERVLQDRRNGKPVIGSLLGIEGAHPLEGKIENLGQLERAGYRVIALQHFFDNELGGSLHGTSNQGLTPFGREVVRQVEARNLILDVAHSSPQVILDVLEITKTPIILSHTGIHSACPTKRNIPDGLMKKIAASGGVIGIGYWADATCDESPPGVAKVIRAAVELVGEDHVSLGSDYDGAVKVGFDVSELAALTEALMKQGLNAQQIRKVMGENLIRVLRARLKP